MLGGTSCEEDAYLKKKIQSHTDMLKRDFTLLRKEQTLALFCSKTVAKKYNNQNYYNKLLWFMKLNVLHLNSLQETGCFRPTNASYILESWSTIQMSKLNIAFKEPSI